MLGKRWAGTLIYVPFVLGTLMFYCNYLYIRFQDEPHIPLPTPAYQSHHAVCDAACNVISDQMCREWVSHRDNRMCQFSCDAYLDDDKLDNVSDWHDIFRCAALVNNPQSLNNCGVVCTPMMEL